MADAPEEGADDFEKAPNGQKKIIIGVCAMRRKAHSKPMQAIMTRILEYYHDWLTFNVFPEEMILNEPVDKWPLCDCLISFHATDFPLHKAIEYERLRRPYVINDLHRQFDLLDRRKVFRALARAGITHPRHCVLNRHPDGEDNSQTLKEGVDAIEVNGMVFQKPFVEKPVSAEDHNVYIYYPSSVGGGSQRLFRKINDRSSKYSSYSNVRRDGSFIYEEFIPADGTDVKVYAVGPFYAHAEARKAPGLDGKVERDSDGKEVRYPVILSAKEKMIARRVVCAFGQTVCGFDLLRANGNSYVCDVNGFSFVKTSTKYYEDTAKILGNTILRRLGSSLSIPFHIPFQDDETAMASTPSGKWMELRCVIAVIRHGDRTPKQKTKLVVNDPRFFALFDKYDGNARKEIKMKRPNQLVEVLTLVRTILGEEQANRQRFSDELARLTLDTEEYREVEKKHDQTEKLVKKYDQMRTVLEMYGHFSGINRKVQMKYLKPKNDGEEIRKKPSLMLIIKWGGELTTAGVLQAEALGKLFRTLYPGIKRTDGKECAEDTQGLGFLRLHSTYRHDLKIYSSDEGRVQMTAAAFAKGMLALEGELTPIMMQMVKSSNTDGLLNDDYNARQFQSDLKSYLHQALQVDRDFTPEDYAGINPSGLKAIANAMEFIKNPRKMCHEIAGYVVHLLEIIKCHEAERPHKTLYLNESYDLAYRRWAKELREFRTVKKNDEGVPKTDFDISKIPDIYDNIKYDLEHNPELACNSETIFERLYLCVKNMADIVVPQEYGISEESKISIAQRVCTPLLGKVRNDLHRCIQNPEESDENQTRLDPRASEGIATPMRHVRTRLYFTSESHIHTLMNLIRYGGLCSPEDKKWQRAMNFLSSVTEFNYMTQVVMMVYEDNTKQGTDRFHIELLFSPGLYPCFQTEKERIYGERFNSAKQKLKPTTGTPRPADPNDKVPDRPDGDPTIPIVQEPSASSAARRDSMSASAKAAFDNFVGQRSKSTDSSMVSGAPGQAKARIVPPRLTTQTAWMTASENKEGGDASDSSFRSVDDYGKKDASDDELAPDAVNLVVLSEIDVKMNDHDHLARRHRSPSNNHNHNLLDEDSAKAANESASFIEHQRAVGNGLMKSLSDITCNRRTRSEGTADESEPPAPVAAENREETVAEENDDAEEEAAPATVGNERSRWARSLVNDSRRAMGHETLLSDIDERDRRPSALTLFQSPPPPSAAQQTDDSSPKNTDELVPTLAPSGGSSATLSSATNLVDEMGNPRRSRFPYRFKHHTVNLFTTRSGVENRLISNQVILGSGKRQHVNNPAVLSTAVIARSNSAPRLQTCNNLDEIAVSEIRRFWPPLRSLETLHDSIAYKQLDLFFEQILNNSTPLPSPPKTPITGEQQLSLDVRMKNTIARLKAMNA